MTKAAQLAERIRRQLSSGDFAIKCLGEFLGKPGEGGFFVESASAEGEVLRVAFEGRYVLDVVNPRLCEATHEGLAVTEADEVTLRSDEGLLVRVVNEGPDIVASVAIAGGEHLVHAAQDVPMFEVVRAY